MSQKTFYTNLTSLKLPEIKTISTKIHNKGLIRKEKKNKIRLVDNNSVISHIFVRKEQFARGNSLKLLKVRLQHRRDDFYTGNFLLATSKMNLKSAATNFLQKLENLRRRKKEISVPRNKVHTIQNTRILSLKSSQVNVLPRSRKTIVQKMRKTVGDERRMKVKSWFVNSTSKNASETKRKSLNRLKRILPLRLRKKIFHGKILQKGKLLSSKKEGLKKLKRFSRKFPVILAGPSLGAGFKAYGCGMRKFLPRSSLLLAGKKILSHIQKKTQLDTKNWQQLKTLKSVIPFRVLPAMLGQSLKMTPLRFKNSYSQVSMKKWKKTRAIRRSRGRKPAAISFKSVFIHTHKKLIRKRLPELLPRVLNIQDENNAKSNKKTNRYFSNKSNTKNTTAFPVRNSDRRQEQQKRQNNIHQDYHQKKHWDRRQGKKDITIQSQQKPGPKR